MFSSLELVISATELFRSNSEPKKQIFFRFRPRFLKKQLFMDPVPIPIPMKIFSEFRLRFRKIPIIFVHDFVISNTC